VSQPKIAKNEEIYYFGGSRTSKVIDVDISKKLVTSACYYKQDVFICNCFYARRGNISKITTF